MTSYDRGNMITFATNLSSFFKIASLPKLISSSIFLVKILSLSALTYVLTITIYNVFFHPLRKYPGPISHRITNFYMSYHEICGRSAYHIRDLHEKYGPTVRIRPNELSYTDEQAWNDIYGHKSPNGTGNLPKEEKRLRPETNNTVTILIANEADHRRLRRIQTPMFSDRAIAAQEEFIISYCELLTSRLMEKANSSFNTVDMVLWYTYTTFDILGELAFGESFNGLKSNVLDSWIKSRLLTLKDLLFWTTSNNFMFPLNKIFYRLSPRDSRDAWARRKEFTDRKISDRVTRNSDSQKFDFMSYILQYNDEKGMTDAEIQSNARILIVAGSETSSTLLSGLTYLLLRNRKYLEEITSLIRTTFPTKKDITLLELRKIDYLNNIINESLRLYPPVPNGLPRRTNKGGSVICGDVVPEHTTVSIPIFAANTSTRNWADSMEFVPERWYKDERCPERYRSDKRKVMQPFSQGPRNCIGKNLAMNEMRMIIAHVLWNFDMELGPNVMDWKDQRIYALWEKKPLHVKLYPRKV
ncbi:Cytochrome P450 monooxygenase aclL [Golovinomyces cichoracearum]|uniref:Cytochrome P450 monooxygenase aclL n=1 Tax=Golovinomyces cichoracearum TaxID=62708 RepID=A0A420J0K5_9PEZI|nr:Cytochrome P450 monooxygenase aclL [Golovinomyces cichoracearum]